MKRTIIIDDKELLEYAKTHTAKEIKEHFSVSICWFYYHLKSLGVRYSQICEIQHKKSYKYDYAKIDAYIKEHTAQTKDEISKILNVPKSVISSRCRLLKLNTVTIKEKRADKDAMIECLKKNGFDTKNIL